MNRDSCLNKGICLIVPVTIHCVYPDSYILVVVEVYVKDKLYSRKMKKVFTGHSIEDKDRCSEFIKLIDSLFVDDFKFYFMNDLNINCIHVDVNIQYIYEC